MAPSPGLPPLAYFTGVINHAQSMLTLFTILMDHLAVPPIIRRTSLAQTISSGYMADHLRDVMVNLDLNYKLDNWVKGWWAKAKGNVSVQEASNQDRSKQAPVFSQSISNAGDTAYHRYGSTVNQVNNFTNTSWARYRFVQLSTGVQPAVWRSYH